MFSPRIAASAVLALALTAVGAALAVAQAPATPPAMAPQVQPEPPPPPPPPPVQQAPSTDPFAEQVMMEPKTILTMKGSANWDSAYDTLVDSFKSLYGTIDRLALKAAGPPMTIYTSTDDTGFQYQAGIPLAQEPAEAPKGDITIGKSPGGKMLKFVHRGSYDSMDSTYEAITNYLDEKRLEAQDLFVEEYRSDPVTTAEDKLVVDVYVPVK
jgi:effector-binding domain-containing protein